MPLSDDEREQGFEILWTLKERRAKVSQFRLLTSSYGFQLFKLSTPNTILVSSHQQKEINRLATLLARGRAVIRSAQREFENENGDRRTYHEIEEVQIEEPYRAVLQLRTLGFSLAFVHGRASVTDHEMELLRRVVLSTMPPDRALVLALFQKLENLTTEGGLTVKLCATGLGKSYGRAKQLLRELTHFRHSKREY
jgi:hypothetical protein